MKPHTPHPRIRKTIKWGGAAVTVLLLGVWIGSGWWRIERQSQPNDRSVGVGQGQFWAVDYDRQWFVSEQLDLPELLGWDVGWHLTSRRTFGLRLGGTVGHATVVIPLWPLVGPCLLLTAFVWRLDTLARRARLNLCPKCNYDRAGLGAGVKCPECGTNAANLT